MAIDVVCKSCGETFQVDDRYAGRKGKCPHCKAVVAAPMALEGDQHGIETDIQVREVVGGVDLTKGPDIRADWKRPWIARMRFTGGVLGVMLGVWIVGSIVGSVHDFYFNNPYSRDSRLKDGQICMVSDFLDEETFGPTRCYVFDQEYQRDPKDKKAIDHFYMGNVEFKTLVMVDYDSNDSTFTEPSKHGYRWDERLVHVHYISGMYSGRNGMIQRYKLEILRPH